VQHLVRRLRISILCLRSSLQRRVSVGRAAVARRLEQSTPAPHALRGTRLLRE
jgi:hypothetical protein